MAEGEKILGMRPESGRWIFVIAGLLMNICLGTIYSWSVFRKPLQSLFDVGATQSGYPFMVFLVVFAIAMLLVSGLMEKWGPKKMSIIGGILVGLGWILASQAKSMGMLTLVYGILGGFGVGMVYGCPVAVAARWFPDKRGIAVGFTVMGFGLSALITAPIAKALIDAVGPMPTFAYLGVAFIIILVILSLPLRFPSVQGWKPAGWEPPAHVAAAAVELTPSEMLKTPRFYGLWLCYAIGVTAGLMAIIIASPVGQEIVKLSAGAAATAVAMFAIFNGIGRPIFGFLTDKLTPRGGAVLSFVIIIAASMMMYFGAGEGRTALFMISFAMLWGCLGGWLAIGPTATGSFFGTKYYPRNYAIMFLAYGAGAFIGPYISGRIRDMTGSYLSSFIPVIILAVVGIILALALMSPPKKKEA